MRTGKLHYIMLLCSLAATGQNVRNSRGAVLYLKNGTALEVEVLSLDNDRIAFYRSDYPEGPVFSVPGIRADSVRFLEGELHIFTITEKNRELAAYRAEFQKLTTAQLLADYSHTAEKARGKIPWGISLIGVGSSVTGIGVMLVALSPLFSGSDFGNGAYVATVVAGSLMLGSGISLTVNGGKHDRRLKILKEELEYRGIDPVKSKAQ
ncbi:MAG: hypothetical protein ABS46_17285 [Cytophagaceae bacterium SCN 52-12]|nr:MAG: hypothetical protein ABS46_17285 [Cytophagaceae bacterium SCN 52-12]